MAQFEPLFEEYRAGVLECVHYGSLCAVDAQDEVLFQRGGADWDCFFRSASKPIQVLPVLARGLHAQYGLTEEEAAIFSGSHWGDPEHVRALDSILEKTGLSEDQMVMLPTYPVRPSNRDALLRSNLPPRRIYHNCAGKHLALMLLARELGERAQDYWRRDSRAQRAVCEAIARVSGTPEEAIRVGVDGCGVPVFAVPFRNIARAFLRLARPERIPDERLAEAAAQNFKRLHAHPNMLAGEGLICSMITADPDLIGKSGALGVYAIGIRSLGIGIVSKISDGSHAEFEAVAIALLRRFGAARETLRALEERFPQDIINDNREHVGYRKCTIDR